MPSSNSNGTSRRSSGGGGCSIVVVGCMGGRRSAKGCDEELRRRWGEPAKMKLCRSNSFKATPKKQTEDRQTGRHRVYRGLVDELCVGLLIPPGCLYIS